MAKIVLPTMWGEVLIFDTETGESYFDGEVEPQAPHDDELAEKIMTAINERTIKTLDGRLSLYKKELVIIINGVEHNLSSSVGDDVWRKNVGDNIYNLNNPQVNYEIRVELSKIVNAYVKEFDPAFEGSIIL